MHAGGYAFDRKACFPTKPHRNRHFTRVILWPDDPITFAPAQPLQLLGDHSLPFGFGCFASQFPGMVFSQLTFHARQLLLAEGLTAHIPTAAKHLERFLIRQ